MYGLVEFKPHLSEEWDLYIFLSYNQVGKNFESWKSDSLISKAVE